ncbi:MAG: transketolase [Anaerolineae bacterium]|nr:transketolase [Anaerolineae bacterium]NUQ05228.1 transketolase [Anaerolineae bacterium]
MSSDLQMLAVNTIRTLSIDAVQKANSGHPGLPMGAAPMAYALWAKHLQHNPRDPHWANRDRFVLSAGHGSMLIYALLYLTGYDLSLDDLKSFRQWGSKTAGHPEYHLTPGVETTTGPLGQGTANAVGFALAEAFLAARYNRPGHEIVNHYTYALVGDGDLMEGVSSEAASLAGLWGLGKLIYLYDSNKVTLDGDTEMTFTEDVVARFKAYGWHTLYVEDGNDVEAISRAIGEAKRVADKPTLIEIRTIIGYGSPNKQGTSEAHGAPLGKDEIKLVKEFYGWSQEEFFVPGEALEHFREAVEAGQAKQDEWARRFEAYRAAYPELAAEFERALQGQLPSDWDADIPRYAAGKEIATRVVNGDVLNAIARRVPTFIGGDADLAGSTRTLIKGEGNTGHGKPAARNLRFGVREHAMGAVVNGLALHGGVTKPYSATFLQFSDYMRPAIRLGALMGITPLYIFTHDSIGLGEDGPTHQPVEHVMALRLIPDLYVFRPADANETSAAWREAMLANKPVVLIFTRQNLPVLVGDGLPGGVDAIHAGTARGGYVLADCDGMPEILLLGAGSEVHIAHEAWRTLSAEGVRARLVSLPSWGRFDEQPQTYKDSVLPPNIRARVSIEAGVTLGWERYVGADGVVIGVDRFGTSAPYQRIYQEFGLTSAAVVQAARSLLAAK